jgi:hypothetical protein
VRLCATSVLQNLDVFESTDDERALEFTSAWRI